MKIYVVDWENKTIKIFQQGVLKTKKNFHKEVINHEDRFGVVCSEISQGNSLRKAVRTGLYPFLSVNEFLILVSSDKTYAKMYESAKKHRYQKLTEDVVDEDDEKKLKVFALKLEILRKELNLDSEMKEFVYRTMFQKLA